MLSPYFLSLSELLLVILLYISTVSSLTILVELAILWNLRWIHLLILSWGSLVYILTAWISVKLFDYEFFLIFILVCQGGTFLVDINLFFFTLYKNVTIYIFRVTFTTRKVFRGNYLVPWLKFGSVSIKNILNFWFFWFFRILLHQIVRSSFQTTLILHITISLH